VLYDAHPRMCARARARTHTHTHTHTHTQLIIYEIRCMQVIGIHGLRVADDSIMPEIISAHTNISIFMIAEIRI